MIQYSRYSLKQRLWLCETLQVTKFSRHMISSSAFNISSQSNDVMSFHAMSSVIVLDGFLDTYLLRYEVMSDMI